jgi:hypothetical protein
MKTPAGSTKAAWIVAGDLAGIHFLKGVSMIVNRISRRTCAVVALLGLSLFGANVWAYLYTWEGGSTGYWCEADNWSRTGCGSPCEECPDDTGDDAIIESSVTFLQYVSDEIDDLTVSNGDVRLGPTGTGICGTPYDLIVDTVIIEGSTNGAKLRGSHCGGLSTN